MQEAAYNTESEEDLIFPGQQEGERVLYTIFPHALRLWVGWARIGVAAALAWVLWGYAAPHLKQIEEDQYQYGYIGIALVALFGFWWIWHQSKVARAYLTDRRIVRFEAAFPVLEKRRALLWTEVTKTSAYCKNTFLRALKVGTLRVVPFVHQLDDVEIIYTYYVEDLVSYIDKIVYLVKSQSPDLAKLRPFVAKAKGKRYAD